MYYLSSGFPLNSLDCGGGPHQEPNRVTKIYRDLPTLQGREGYRTDLPESSVGSCRTVRVNRQTKRQELVGAAISELVEATESAKSFRLREKWSGGNYGLCKRPVLHQFLPTWRVLYFPCRLIFSPCYNTTCPYPSVSLGQAGTK